jgi:hypothetical protein
MGRLILRKQMDSVHMQMTDLEDGTVILAANQHLALMLDPFRLSSIDPDHDNDHSEYNF